MGKVILASASPRRKELLERAGISFEVCPARVEETYTSTKPEEIVKELALRKALAVAGEREEGDIVIGADTIVVHKGKIMGKPKDREDSYQTLTELAGDTHQVYTGTAVIEKRKEKDLVLNFAQFTDVTFYPVSSEEILSYVNTGDCADKAGSYAIQGPFGLYVKEIRGDYCTVIGLSLPRLLQETARAGIPLMPGKGEQP